VVKSRIKKILANSPVLYRQAPQLYKRFNGRSGSAPAFTNVPHFPAAPVTTDLDPNETHVQVTAPAAGVKVLTTVEELDAQLLLVHEAAQRSDDELRRALASFEFGLDRPLPKDPYSED
jgi:hypothetical protein